MKERGIIFSTEMVRAIQEGRKTQTRRVINPQPDGVIELCIRENIYGFADDTGMRRSERTCPYGQSGDLLYVRETWAEIIFPGGKAFLPRKKIIYKSDGDINNSIKWKSSRYMPKKYAHIWLEIIDIRVERLQEITEEDCIAEGIFFDNTYWRSVKHPIKGSLKCWATAKMAFIQLWDSINKKRGYGWETNPYVWVIEFKRK